MSWSEKFADGSSKESPSQEYDALKDSLLPVTVRESKSGNKFIAPIDFQPVKSPKNYEAEFAVKGEDLIFHFWPWGYHDAEADGLALPRFKPNFEKFLTQAIAAQFGNKTFISRDEDVGAFFIKAPGFGLNQFHRELAIKACEELHNMFED